MMAAAPSGTPLARLLGWTLPLLTGVAAVLLDVLPLPAPGGGGLAPLLSLCVVYFWTLHAPDLLPPLSVFAVGLLLDVLSGMPPGLSAAALLLVDGAVLGGRRVLLAQPFAVAWAAFGLVALAFGLLRWLLATVWFQHLFPPGPSLAEAALTFAVYPPLGWLLARLHHQLAPAPDAAGS
jgi:rod shape-determining protein MreD